MMGKPEVFLAMFRFLFGVIIGVLLLPAAVWVWLHHGHPPVAVADSPLPFEREITGGALHARIDKEAPADSPVKADEAAFVAGAKIYREQCAFCHGVSGTPSQVGQHMFPDAPPLWEKHPHSDVVGVSDDPPGETYWKVANGIRLSGMPAYKGTLSETEMWQVSVLLANADKPLPPAAVEVLKTPLNFSVAPVSGVSVTPVGKPTAPAN
jgi:mono/diheme cytochrome c family protein